MPEGIANVDGFEIEITSEMIAAGKEALCGVSLIDDDWDSIVLAVFCAMQERRESLDWK